MLELNQNFLNIILFSFSISIYLETEFNELGR